MGVADELGAAEDQLEEVRVHQEREPGQPRHHQMEQRDVQDDPPLLALAARQEVEGAHGEAEREDGGGGVDEQERLLVQAELGLAQAAHEDERQGEAEPERDRLRGREPDDPPCERRAHQRRSVPGVAPGRRRPPATVWRAHHAAAESRQPGGCFTACAAPRAPAIGHRKRPNASRASGTRRGS